MGELISVVGNFDLAIKNQEKQGQIDLGVKMIQAQLLDLLKRRGLERFSAEIGKPLDPATSEAISQLDSDLPEGYVVEEAEPGYRLHDKILRASRVKVSKGAKKE